MLRFLTFVMGCLFMLPASATEIVAHRGASEEAPENTLASVNLAWAQGADAVEIDIYLTADNRIVAIHDKTTKRTAGKDQPVVEQTLAELKTLDAGSWKSPKYAGERIPTLEEIVRTIPTGKRVFIEIKTGPEILPVLKQVLEQEGRPASQTPLISFSLETMEAAKKLLPHLKVYWVAQIKRDKETGKLNYTNADLIQSARKAGLDGLNLGNNPPVDAEFLKQLKQAGLELYLWTVNDPDKFEEYYKLGVDGVETDRTSVMVERIRGKAK